MKLKVKRIMIALVITSAILLIFFYGQINRGIRPLNQARDETIALAKAKAGLKDAKDFYWYNGTETYFTLLGSDEEDEEIYVIVKQKGGDILTLAVDETLSKSDAIQQTISECNPQKILEARIGVIDEVPIWEVSFLSKNNRLGYYIIQLEDGQWLRTLENI
ncbi:DUF5590 domain-containing protein [Allofustis seminis]|uniref:cell wall elongation regulator TseB-like domain-containing protein n=1 Tax=Allofustis seminis TaxID=166939 RepID=UPI0003787FFB|nr:DUF5590 domain-containing protein [Allofustis seminis]